MLALTCEGRFAGRCAGKFAGRFAGRFAGSCAGSYAGGPRRRVVGVIGSPISKLSLSSDEDFDAQEAVKIK